MKKLFIVRHAKSSWDSPGIRDFDRVLMEVGKKRTRKVIQFLRQKEIKVDLIISSPAVRAYQTAKLIAKGINYPIDSIKPEMKFYDGEIEQILDIIYGIANDYSSIMIVGHNPTFSDLASLILKTGIEILPTTGVAAISFNTNNWEKVPESEVKLDFFISPKML